MKIFLIFLVLACVLQSATAGIFSSKKKPPAPRPVKCKPNEKKVTLSVKVDHNQQSIKQKKIMSTSIRSSKQFASSYSNLQSSKDTSTSVKTEASFGWGFGKVSASAQSSFSSFNQEINSNAKSSSDYSFDKKLEETHFQDGELQILRVVTTTVTIDNVKSTVTKTQIVDTASTGFLRRWTETKLKNASIEYLNNEFPGEESKIKGLTYTSEACFPKKGTAPKKG